MRDRQTDGQRQTGKQTHRGREHGDRERKKRDNPVSTTRRMGGGGGGGGGGESSDGSLALPIHSPLESCISTPAPSRSDYLLTAYRSLFFLLLSREEVGRGGGGVE